MIQNEEIAALLANNECNAALDAINENINEDSQDDKWYELRGKTYWRMGEKAKAMADFAHAVELNPNSPAKAALELARNVMDFFNPDMLNP